MNSICKGQDMPVLMDVYHAMANDEGYRSAIARAREAQQDFCADETIELADSATPEDWQVKKLQIWARQWRAAKLAPKKYGENSSVKVDANVSIDTDGLNNLALAMLEQKNATDDKQEAD